MKNGSMCQGSPKVISAALAGTYTGQQQYRKILEADSSVTIVKASIHIAREKAVVKHSCIFTKKTHIDRALKTIDITVSADGLLTRY